VTPLRVTAVITAHDRRSYLAEAIASAANAGADELIVVRNFTDPVAGVSTEFTDVFCPVEETGAKQAAGVERAHGDIVAFLDDDDRWLPSKVARVRQVFEESTSLVYFCHGQRSVDEHGTPVEAHHPEYAGRDPSRFQEWNAHDVDGLFDRLWPGNNSSTAIRRTWAREWTGDLRTVGWGADRFWMAVALIDGRPVRIVGEPLVELRLHGENMSHSRDASPEEFRRRHALSSGRFARSCREIARIAAARLGPRAPLTRHFEERAVAFAFFRDLENGDRPRRAAGRALVGGPGFRDRGVLEASGVALLSPTLARRLLYRSSRRRWSLRAPAPPRARSPPRP